MSSLAIWLLVQRFAQSITREILGTSVSFPIAVEWFTHIEPSGFRSIWQGTHADQVGSSLPWGRYSSVRAVDEQVKEAQFIVIGQSVRVKKSCFCHRCYLADP